MRRLLGLLCWLCCFTAAAQYKVNFYISELPAYHKPGDALFVAGYFNNWNPGDTLHRMQAAGNKYIHTIVLPEGKHEFKITRGSWDKVESGEGGFPTANRVAEIRRDTTLVISIPHWADHFPKQKKVSTASKQVHLVDSAFYMPELKRYRRVQIYLPRDYASSGKKYPVLYMQDGQNVFDAATSFSGEWGVDETLDSMGSEVGEIIVVAIDNGGDRRINEYSPRDMEKYGKGEGDKYVDFLVKTLMPYIHKHYRTRKKAKDQWIAGSSMGGLISFYAIMKYPQKFGGAGVFSPAFWIAPGMKSISPAKAKKVKGKIYFFAGQKEGESMVPDMLAVFEQMNRHSGATMTTVIRSEGEHSEDTWRNEFPLFYKWMMRQ